MEIYATYINDEEFISTVYIEQLQINKKSRDNSVEIIARNLTRNLTKEDIWVDSKPNIDDSITTQPLEELKWKSLTLFNVGNEEDNVIPPYIWMLVGISN